MIDFSLYKILNDSYYYYFGDQNNDTLFKENHNETSLITISIDSSTNELVNDFNVTKNDYSLYQILNDTYHYYYGDYNDTLYTEIQEKTTLTLTSVEPLTNELVNEINSTDHDYSLYKLLNDTYHYYYGDYNDTYYTENQEKTTSTLTSVESSSLIEKQIEYTSHSHLVKRENNSNYFTIDQEMIVAKENSSKSFDFSSIDN